MAKATENWQDIGQDDFSGDSFDVTLGFGSKFKSFEETNHHIRSQQLELKLTSQKDKGILPENFYPVDIDMSYSSKVCFNPEH